ncbi:hypothetical protein S40285_09778, partial [Stachybotrys chlorohalonatus IBT 40285]|jgi:hypothetical protein
MAAD